MQGTGKSFDARVSLSIVMPALVAGIHVLFASRKTWMPGTRPGMTVERPVEKGETMTLIINNHDVEELLTMEMTLEALEESYLALARQEAVCRPRIDIRIPTSDPSKNYQWGTMEGGSTRGYSAIRMKSDIMYERAYLDREWRAARLPQ
jgi:hypothetical protein